LCIPLEDGQQVPKHLAVTNIFLDFPIYLQSEEIHSENGVLGGEGG
jgi:hypothetical protein